jgi:hypothetical protein
MKKLLLALCIILPLVHIPVLAKPVKAQVVTVKKSKVHKKYVGTKIPQQVKKKQKFN